MNPDVDWFFTKESKWKEEFQMLRKIVLDTGLTEELKWGCPCYTYDRKNVVLIHGFTNYCALLFMKGALLNDEKKILVKQTDNVQSARQVRFTSISQIKPMKVLLKVTIKEAIELEKVGARIQKKSTTDFNMPEEFRRVLEDMPELRTSFEKLTPGRQRGYLLHFSAPKQSKTREARIEKHVERILQGKGLDD